MFESLHELGFLVGQTKNKKLITFGDKNIYVERNDPKYFNYKLEKFYWIDKKHSEETKIKIGKANSEKQKGNKNS